MKRGSGFLRQAFRSAAARAGFPYFTYRLGNPEEDVDQQALTRFQQLKPVDRIGYSIDIYHITLEDANRVRDELNMSPLTGDSRR